MIPLLLAQCVMCFRTAAAQQGARAHVLDIGILLLGVPPFMILAGFCVLFYRKNLITRAGREDAISARSGPPHGEASHLEELRAPQQHRD